MLLRTCLILALCSLTLAAQQPRPGAANAFPTGPETVKKFTLPPGFSATCYANEPLITKPIAMDFDAMGRVWVLECHSYPHKQPAGKGKDCIKILEDTNGDGVADKVSVFAEGLNLATGLAIGFGGVFVGEAPELVFYKDTDGDGKADQRTVLLDGWGYQDTHETLNSFIWGPDGWLYGCHGVFTHSNVGRPGCKPEERVKLNAGIWRFHPRTQVFELFAEGTSNPWGYDYDEHGEGFLTCCVIPHLFHVIPGGRYARQAGQNFNPHNYGEIKWICEDLHFHGNNPHQANKDPRSLKYGGGHAHAGCLIYQGGSFPKEWHGKIFMNNIHGGRINVDRLKPNGSTYIGNYDGDFLVSNDPNFRVVSLKTGPDGSIYLVDWYDPQICHNLDAKIWNQNYGRIYKVSYSPASGERKLAVEGGEKREEGGEKNTTSKSGERKLAVKANEDLEKLTTPQLADRLFDKNSWQWRTALRLLNERNDEAAAIPLREIMTNKQRSTIDRLRALWALSTQKSFNNSDTWSLLGCEDRWLRAWSVRLMADRADLASSCQNEFRALAQQEKDAVVLRELASACQRLSPKERHALASELASRHELTSDPLFPFLVWLAEEPVFQRDKWWALPYGLLDPARKAELAAENGAVKHLLAGPSFYRDFLTARRLRRLASQDVNQAVGLLMLLKDREFLLQGASGLLDGLRGRRLEAPAEWRKVGELRQLFKNDPEVLSRLNRLGIHFGDPDAVAAMEREAADSKLPAPQRIEAIQALAVAQLPSSIKPLLDLVADAKGRLRVEAVRALGNFDSDAIPAALLAGWTSRDASFKREAIVLLVSKKDWAAALLRAIQAKQIAKEELTEADARRILDLETPALAQQLETVWGKLRTQTPDSVKQMMAKYTKQLRDLPADRAAGKAVFTKHCQVCHKLFGEGHTVGPELTGANRRDPNYLLENILDPNKLVGKEYYSVTVEDKQGRLHTGLLAEETPDRVTLKGENDKLTTLARADIEQMKTTEKSMMPEGLPTNMSEVDLRNLVAYLMEDAYLTRGKIAGPFKMALDFAGPIETAADPLKAVGIAWKPFQVGPLGQIDMERLKVLAPPTDSTAYVYFEVSSPTPRKTTLEMAADEDLKVWVNGKEVFTRTRTVQPQRVEVDLKEGVNRLLFKVHNIYGPSWLWARLADPKRELELGTDQP